MNVDQQRRVLYGLINQGAKRLPGIDDDQCYRDWLNQQTGKTSLRAMTLDELQQLAAVLRAYSVIAHPNTPTARQRYTLNQLAKKMGFEGDTDDRVIAFSKRTIKCPPQNANRKQLSTLITAMQRWSESNVVSKM